MPDRSTSLLRTLTVFVASCLGASLWGCAERHAGVTATGNTGRISGTIDSASNVSARLAAGTGMPVKVFLYLSSTAGVGDSLCDSVSTVRGGTYEFKKLPDGSFKVYAVSDADGWHSDTLRVQIKGGADVPLVVPIRAPVSGAGVRNGMTWIKRKRDDRFGIDFLHCKGAINGVAYECNPTAGDQPCTAVLPLLCSKPENLARPAYQVDYPASGATMNIAYYGGWQGGRTALGARVAGTALRSKATADSICAEHLGEGWAMSGFHDGRYIADMDSLTFHDGTWNASSASEGGWGFYSQTASLPMDARFWTYMDNQPANCWDP